MRCRMASALNMTSVHQRMNISVPNENHPFRLIPASFRETSCLAQTRAVDATEITGLNNASFSCFERLHGSIRPPLGLGVAAPDAAFDGQFWPKAGRPADGKDLLVSAIGCALQNGLPAPPQQRRLTPNFDSPPPPPPPKNAPRRARRSCLRRSPQESTVRIRHARLFRVSHWHCRP